MSALFTRLSQRLAADFDTPSSLVKQSATTGGVLAALLVIGVFPDISVTHEPTFWAGVALVALPVLSGWQLATMISPVFVYLLLTRVSGITMLEAMAEKRWGTDPDFIAYRDSTPALMLRKPRG